MGGGGGGEREIEKKLGIDSPNACIIPVGYAIVRLIDASPFHSVSLSINDAQIAQSSTISALLHHFDVYPHTRIKYRHFPVNFANTHWREEMIPMKSKSELASSWTTDKIEI